MLENFSTAATSQSLSSKPNLAEESPFDCAVLAIVIFQGTVSNTRQAGWVIITPLQTAVALDGNQLGADQIAARVARRQRPWNGLPSRRHRNRRGDADPARFVKSISHSNGSVRLGSVCGVLKNTGFYRIQTCSNAGGGAIVKAGLRKVAYA